MSFSQFFELSSKNCQKEQKRGIIDTHNHFLQFYYTEGLNLTQKEFQNDLDEWKQKNNQKMVIVCTNLNKIDESDKFCKENHFFYSLGLHPHQVQNLVEKKQGSNQQLENDIQTLENYVKQQYKLHNSLYKSNIVAIGETGFSSQNPSILSLQKHFLIKQLDISLKYNLRCIIHAHRQEELQILIDLIYDNFQKYKGLKLIIHGFSANPKQLEELLKFDTYFSFNPYSLQRSKTFVKKIISKFGIQKLLLETDSPFNKIEKNSPISVNELALDISELINMQVDQLIKTVNQNAIQAYQLDKYEQFNL